MAFLAWQSGILTAGKFPAMAEAFRNVISNRGFFLKAQGAVKASTTY